jgi:hypothetical protein
MLPMWVSVEPLAEEIRLSLSVPDKGVKLRARLPAVPVEPRALAMLLEALVAWHGQPLCAVVDADASDVSCQPERWARLLGELDGSHIQVKWSSRPARPPRDRFLGALGGFRHADRVLAHARGGGVP